MRWRTWIYLLSRGRIPLVDSTSCVRQLCFHARIMRFSSADEYCDYLLAWYRFCPPLRGEMESLSLLLNRYSRSGGVEEFVLSTHYMIASETIMLRIEGRSS